MLWQFSTFLADYNPPGRDNQFLSSFCNVYLFGQLKVGLFNLLLRRRPRNAQDFVVGPVQVAARYMDPSHPDTTYGRPRVIEGHSVTDIL